jgi:hypothetical protein
MDVPAIVIKMKGKVSPVTKSSVDSAEKIAA